MTALARKLGLPVATTRRWTNRLLAEGWLTMKDRGLIITTETLNRPEFIENAASMMLNNFQMLTALKQSGFFEDVYRIAGRQQP